MHLLAVQVLTLGALASVVVCVVRDPGGVGRERNAKDEAARNRKNGAGQRKTARSQEHDADAEDGVTTSLLRGGGESYDEDGGDDGGGDAEDGYDVHGGDLAAAEDASSSPGVDMDEMALNGRWCARCRHARPERAHHCGTCGRCILKMGEWVGFTPRWGLCRALICRPPLSVVGGQVRCECFPIFFVPRP